VSSHEALNVVLQDAVVVEGSLAPNGMGWPAGFWTAAPQHLLVGILACRNAWTLGSGE
jgi:hypothetical protein